MSEVPLYKTRPDSSLGLGCFQYESLQTLESCSLLARKRSGSRVVLNLRTTTLQKCAAVPRRTRI